MEQSKESENKINDVGYSKPPNHPGGTVPSGWLGENEKENGKMKRTEAKVLAKRVLSLVMAIAFVLGMICINKTDVDAATSIPDGEYDFASSFTTKFYKKNGYLYIKMGGNGKNSRCDVYMPLCDRTVMKVKVSKKCKCYFKKFKMGDRSKGKKTTFAKIKKRVQYNRKMRKIDFYRIDTMATRIVIKNGQVVEIIHTKGFVGAS